MTSCEFSNCNTEELSETEAFVQFKIENGVIPCSSTEQSTSLYVRPERWEITGPVF